tara:strand:+ start:515 stop:1588 length:1074 start_codon:yes stop_codon:yes gene_type:complete
MKRIIKLTGTVFFIGIVYLFFYPIELEPIARISPPYPGMEGDFKKNNELAEIDFREVDGIGPESIARDSFGYFYSGLENGDIIKFDSLISNKKIIGNTGGRPLGMKFAPNGMLVIADQVKGLIALDSLGEIKTLLNEIDETPILFADDLAITKEGIIYFSDATQRNATEVENEFWEQRATGRIISYDINTGESSIVLDNLFFANGVALDSNEEFILINETFGVQINKYWIKGEKKGTTELFNNKLPGYPDNITFSNNIFWVAIPSQRAIELEPLTNQPFIRSILLRLPRSIIESAVPKPYSMVLGFDIDGKLKYNLQDPKGGFDYITSVLQVDDKIYLGSLKETRIGIYTLKKETND